MSNKGKNGGKKPIKPQMKRKTSKPPVDKDADVEMKRRADWEHHNELIYSAFITIATNNKRYPKLKEIAAQTGLSIKTIHLHLQESNFDQLKKKYAIFTEAALFKLATLAASGKSKDYMELFFRIVHGVGEKQQLDITSGGKRIGNFDMSALSDEEILAIKSAKRKLNAQ